jgi:PBP4 family serine-type D-alanyl-D-alanine carboxypeptidase
MLECGISWRICLRNKSRSLLFFTVAISLFLLLTQNPLAGAQDETSLANRIEKIMNRPEFAHANFGLEFYSLDTGKVIYAHNADKLFVPASTTKILTEGTLLAKLGADFRFHTRIYRTGPIDSRGRLRGDLILVASGDPNLSNRVQPDDTLAFVDLDHSYQGPALPGDPLAVIKQLAKDVAAKGIREIEGRVLIDTSLFPDGPAEGGTNVVMSSIMVNDNVIDLLGKPGAKIGDLVALESSPQTSYIKFVNHVITTAAGTKSSLDTPSIAANPDGSVLVTLSGNMPLDLGPQTASVAVPSPSRFAQAVLREALLASGIEIKTSPGPVPADFAPFARFYIADNQVGEHISPPLAEEIKVTLKVSQNLHAGMGPYLLGALVAKDTKNPLDAGFVVERDFLQSAKLDLSGRAMAQEAIGPIYSARTSWFII